MTPLIAKVNELELLRGRVARLELDLAFDLGIVPGKIDRPTTAQHAKPAPTPAPVLPTRKARKGHRMQVTPAIRSEVIRLSKDGVSVNQIHGQIGLSKSSISIIRREAKKKPK